MNPQKRLKNHFLQLEKKNQVLKGDIKNEQLEKDVNSIVIKTLDKIVKKEPRFGYKLHGTGSYYDGVKVGFPDEFDFLVELTTLSTPGAIKYMPTEDPGFVQIRPDSTDVSAMWKDCLILPSDLKGSKATQALYHTFPGESNPFGGNATQNNTLLEESDVSQLFIDSEKPVVAPTLLQTTFKKLFDEVMFEIELPDHWEHGGCERPNYSGCRRHGPATMIQLVHTNETEEIKLNIDITLGIGVPVPVNFKRELNMNVFDNVDCDSPMCDILHKAMKSGPCVHLIPLYSRMLVKTRRFNNKFSFRISCSCIEKEILDCWPDDSGPKKCMRILKTIRDNYFSEGWRKTYRCKKKFKKHHKKTNQHETTKPPINSSPKVHQRKRKKPMRKGMPAKVYLERIHTAENKWNIEMERNEKILDGELSPVKKQAVVCPVHKPVSKPRLDKYDSDTTDEEEDVQLQVLTETLNRTDLSGYNETTLETSIADETQFKNTNDFLEMMKPREQHFMHLHNTERNYAGNNELHNMAVRTVKDSDTTDITELEEMRTKEDAFRKFQQTRFKYQTKDISDMVTEPGSGEYYGPKAYMASIEIKTYILRLLGHLWEPENWTDDKVCEYVEEFLKSYHTLLLEHKMIKNFFFDTLVCAPITEEQRLKALEKYNQLQKELNNIMEQE